MSDEGERLFLSEAIKCYNVKAFRAAIIMAWNLAYDRLLHWIIADQQRLVAFNSRIVTCLGPKLGAGLAWRSGKTLRNFKRQGRGNLQ